MALIKCPKCGKEISDKAVNCPNCGYGVQKKSQKINKKKYIVLVLILLIVLGIGYGITFGKNRIKDFRQCEEKMDLIKSAEVGDVITFGKYNDDMEWVVTFDDNRHLLLLSKETVAHMKYISAESEFTWKNSDIRKWLNDDFYNDVFSKEEQQYIESVWVNNGAEEETNDRLFILSEGEGKDIFPNEEIRKLVFDGRETIWLRSNSEERSGKYYGDALFEYGTNYSYGKAEVGCENGIHAAFWIDATDKN